MRGPSHHGVAPPGFPGQTSALRESASASTANPTHVDIGNLRSNAVKAPPCDPIEAQSAIRRRAIRGGRTQLSCEREKARLATILVPLNACGDERSHEGARHNHAEGPRVPLQACHRSHSHGTRKAEQPSSNEAPHAVCRSCEGWPIAHAPSPSCRKNDEGPVPDLDRPPDEDHRP